MHRLGQERGRREDDQNEQQKHPARGSEHEPYLDVSRHSGAYTSAVGEHLGIFRRVDVEETRFQVGKCSFLNNPAYRGSWCKLFSRGSTLVVIRPLLRWA